MHTARVKSGGDGLPTMDEIEEKKRIAEEEEKEKEEGPDNTCIPELDRGYAIGSSIEALKYCCWGNGIWVFN